MFSRRGVLGVAIFALHAKAQSSLYPAINPQTLANAFNISVGCVTALNTTVSCDQTLLSMAGDVDNYLWDITNVTALCTSSCVSSAQTWYNNVVTGCASDNLLVGGKQIPLETIPGRVVDGLNIACLTPTTDVTTLPGVNGAVLTTVNETGTGDDPTVEKRQTSGSGYCLVDSYGWTGSDIIRPDCTAAANQADPQCIDPTNVTDYNQRISNLYPDSVLCSTCFINMFYLRVASPYLPDLDYSDYLVAQYYDIIQVCNKQMPDLTVRLLPDYPDAPGYFAGQPVNTTMQPFVGAPTNIAINATLPNGTCSGQTLTYNQIVKVADAIKDPSSVDFCDALSQNFNLTSGDLYQAFTNYGCDTQTPGDTTATWCVPRPCTIYEVASNQTCDQVATAVSTPQYNITSQQLLQYNPNLQGICDQLLPQYVCITPPGGAYISPPVNATSTNAGQQQRGGGDSSTSGNQTVTGSGNPAVTITAGQAAPSPTQSGIISGCLIFSNASAGDTCYSFAQQHNVTAANLYAWNPVLGAAGDYCSTQFWAGNWYCIGTKVATPSPTATPTPVSPGQAAPSPTQSGIISTCNKYAQANKGDSCEAFATNQGIGTAQLYTWNTQLGPQGQNCTTEFWATYYYCVNATSTVATPTPVPGNPSPAPSPIQDGIISTCNKYFKAIPGDSCYSFAQENAITSSQLYAWNTVLGANGENCNTQFWANEYYCIGVSTTTSKRGLAELGPGVTLTSRNPNGVFPSLNKRDLPTGTCNSQTPCANGACCGSDNLCGYSPKSCGTGCQFNCDAKAECGPYAVAGKQTCPLNVCCSEFGFCGSTSEFCTWTNKDDTNYAKCDTKYGGCGTVKRPSCSAEGSSVGGRSVGYYESWANTRACQNVAPEDLNLDGFTSINFAFAFFDPSTFAIAPMDANGASLYRRFTALKKKKPGLKTYISVGGWSFTDPGATQTAFSNMVSSQGNRAKFINGVMTFMNTFGFDGVDLDWEYPGADDRGGIAADTANYVSLTREMHAAFKGKYGLTVTIPTSYWYLQHFDMKGIQANIDWFNLMAYDLHGVWDAQSKFLGPYIAPHTNITEIDLALDLLWRAGVDSKKVVLGQGWYGRSFTLADPSCNKPNGVCQFTGGAAPGACSKASGILDYEEIADIIELNNIKPTWDTDAGVKYFTYNKNQWISYDDGDTFAQKRDFANSRCLGGLMVWAMDQVNQQAENGFGGSSAAAGADITTFQQDTADKMSQDTLAQLKCYTSACGAGCKAGTNEVAQFNGQPNQLSTNDRCPAKSYRSLCCDSKTSTGKCEWRGYRGAGLACIKGCADGETEVTTNTNQHDAKKGDTNCHGGLQSFCCPNFVPDTSSDDSSDSSDSDSDDDSLADKAKDAAKAAAEAAAEQAALDVAAKAFCRLAVPALLAPLEALEALIPIFGEIADIAEIAATPAIIVGCTQAIEKAGKAEFKIFGKTHTLTPDKPLTKPSNVPDRPAPKDSPPTKTGDKGDKCSTKAKRALPPVQTIYDDLPRMKKLVQYSTRPKDYDWKQGNGYALLAMYPKRYTMDLIPKHYAIVAGYITRRLGPIQSERDNCGTVVKRTQTVTRDWASNGYDLIILKGTNKIGQDGPLTKAGDEIEPNGAAGMPWTGPDSTFDKSYIVWQDLGPIRSGISYQAAFDRNEEFIAAHPDYSYYTNNCYHFAQSLYGWMVNPAAPVKRAAVEGAVAVVGGELEVKEVQIVRRDSVMEDSIPAMFDWSIRIEA